MACAKHIHSNSALKYLELDAPVDAMDFMELDVASY